MLISHKGHTDTIQVYSVTVMTHVKALQAGHSSQGTSEPITPACILASYIFNYYYCCYVIFINQVIVYTDCRLTDTGSDYAGVVSMTSSGYMCQRWDAQTPHVHNFTDSDRFPDYDMAATSNYCRNPDGRAGGPWCHTTDPGVTGETCDIALCTSKYE